MSFSHCPRPDAVLLWVAAVVVMFLSGWECSADAVSPFLRSTDTCTMSVSGVATAGQNASTTIVVELRLHTVSLATPTVDVTVIIIDGNNASLSFPGSHSVECLGEPVIVTTTTSTSRTMVYFPFVFDPNDCVERFLLTHEFLVGNTSHMMLSWWSNEDDNDSVIHVDVMQMGSLEFSAVEAQRPCSSGAPLHAETSEPYCAKVDGVNNGTSRVTRVDFLGAQGNTRMSIASIDVDTEGRPACYSNTTPSPASCAIPRAAWSRPTRELILGASRIPLPSLSVVASNFVPQDSLSSMFSLQDFQAWISCAANGFLSPHSASSSMRSFQDGNTQRVRVFIPSNSTLIVIVVTGGSTRMIALQPCKALDAASALYILPLVLANASIKDSESVVEGRTLPSPIQYCGGYGGTPSIVLTLSSCSVSGEAVSDTWVMSLNATMTVSSRGFVTVCDNLQLQLSNASIEGAGEGPYLVEVVELQPQAPCVMTAISTVGRSPWMQLQYDAIKDVFWMTLTIGAFSLSPCAGHTSD